MKPILLLLLTILGLNASASIGNTNNGNSLDNIDQWINAGRFQATSNMTLATMTAKVKAITGKYKYAIYTGTSSLPGTFLRGTEEIVNPSTNGWYTANLTSNLTLTNGQYYWLAVWANVNGASVYYTAGGSLRWGQYTYGNWPTTLTTTAGSSVNYCIYASDAVVEQLPTTNVRLTWDASPDASVTGYRLYNGVVSGIYTNSVTVGNSLTGTISNLFVGTTYYFVATAYTASGVESLPSNEVIYTVQSPRPETPTGVNIQPD